MFHRVKKERTFTYCTIFELTFRFFFFADGVHSGKASGPFDFSSSNQFSRYHLCCPLSSYTLRYPFHSLLCSFFSVTYKKSQLSLLCCTRSLFNFALLYRTDGIVQKRCGFDFASSAETTLRRSFSVFTAPPTTTNRRFPPGMASTQLPSHLHLPDAHGSILLPRLDLSLVFVSCRLVESTCRQREYLLLKYEISENVGKVARSKRGR